MRLLSRLLPSCPPPPRVSGLRFLEALRDDPGVRAPGTSFGLMPSETEQARPLDWRHRHGFPPLTPEDCHLAAHYPRLASETIEDATSLAK